MRTVERETRYYGFLAAAAVEDQSDLNKKKRKFMADGNIENYDRGKKKNRTKKRLETGVVSFPADIAQETAHAPPLNLHQCDVCGKPFPSCHALRGHNSSHKKAPPPVLITVKKESEDDPLASGTGSHWCKVCGKTFAKGQALGGHMTCHNRKQYSSTLLSHSTISHEHDQLPPPPPSSTSTTDQDQRSAAAIRGGASMEEAQVTSSMAHDEATGSFGNVKGDDDATPIKFEIDLNVPASPIDI